ncbi:MAG: hypothetical protein JSV52_10605, partial [Candidatus Zixiibacteriota bacterium]
TARTKWNHGGDLKERVIDLGLEGKFRIAQANMHARYMRAYQKWGGLDFDGVWLLHNCLSATPSLKFAFGGSVTYAHQPYTRPNTPVMEKELYLSAWFDIRPIIRLYIENWYTYVKGDSLDTGGEIYEGYILRTRWSLQVTRNLSVRLVGQYDNFDHHFDLDPLLTYRLSPFSVFYVGSTYDYCRFNGTDEDSWDTKTCLTSRQFFMKLQYLFQI